LGRQTLPIASATRPGGRPTCWEKDAGSQPGISQLLSLKAELSPFPWQWKRKNKKE
jgi:hypothetical protein